MQWKAGDDLETFQRLNAQDLERTRFGRGGKEGLGEIQSPSQEQEDDHASQQERVGSAGADSGGKQPCANHRLLQVCVRSIPRGAIVLILNCHLEQQGP